MDVHGRLRRLGYILMRVTKALAGAAGAALVGFHSWLLATQFAAGRLVEPWLVFRWLLAVALVAGLVATRRQGGPLFGRRTVAVWIVAALLHGPAVSTDFSGGIVVPAIPDVVAVVLLQVANTLALTFGLWVLASLVAARRGQPLLASQLAGAGSHFRAGSSRVPPRYSPRPPPQR
jgi:hypothetical protein